MMLLGANKTPLDSKWFNPSKLFYPLWKYVAICILPIVQYINWTIGNSLQYGPHQFEKGAYRRIVYRWEKAFRFDFETIERLIVVVFLSGETKLFSMTKFLIVVRGVTVLSVFECIARGQNCFFIRVSRKLIG